MKIATTNDEYRIFIVNEHASHINTKTIEFYVQKRIILLCLSVHIIHILQSLNVDVFVSLLTTYKNDLHEMTRYEIDYAIDKVDFLKLLKSTREKAMTISNIENAYAKTNLESFNFEFILHEYRNRKNSTLNIKSLKTHYSIIIIISNSFNFLVEITIICINSNDEIRNVVMISHNSLEMKKLLKQTLNMSKNVDRIIQKVNKSTLRAFVNVILMIDQIKQLMTLIFKKEFKKKRKKRIVQNAQCLNQKIFDEKRLN